MYIWVQTGAEKLKSNVRKTTLMTSIHTHQKKKKWGFPGCASGKESTSSVGDTRNVSSIPRSGISPGAGNGNPLQYPCLENSMDRRIWQAEEPGGLSPWGHKESDTTEYMHTHTHTQIDLLC